MPRTVHQGFFRVVSLATAVLLTMALLSAGARGMEPAERLLPSSTKGAVLVTDVPKLVEQWKATSLGQLMADPVMKPFAEDLRHQFEDRISRAHERLGLRVKDLKGVPGGQLAVAMVQPEKAHAALVLILDVTGHVKEAEALLDQVTTNMKKQKVPPPTEQVVGGTRVMVFNLPATPYYSAGKAAYFLHDNVLAASDNEEVLKDILRRQMGQTRTGETLAELPAFKTVMGRCQKDAGESVPQLRWFIEPLGYVEAIRSITPEEKLQKRVTVLDIMREQGFTAIQGVGGFVDLHVGSYEVLHRTSILAPPPYKPAPAPYVDKVSMRLLTFPNAKDFAPPVWTPNNVAVCTTFYWNMLDAFDNIGPLFNGMLGGQPDLFGIDAKHEATLRAKVVSTAMRDEFAEKDFPLEKDAKILAEGDAKWRLVNGKSAFLVKKTEDGLKVDLLNTASWDELLQTLRSAPPNGADMDIREELIAPLGRRVTVMTDYQLPITTTSERLLFAVEAKDPEAVAKGIEKFYKNDRLIKRTEHKGYVIWETIEDPRHKEMAAPVVDLPDMVSDEPVAPRRERKGQQKELLPHQAVTVAHGHLLVASHVDFLIKVLEHKESPDPLAQSVDFRVVTGAMEKLGADETCVRSFSRTDEEYRPTYELIREGKMPQSETMFGRLLNSLLTPRKRGAVRDQKISGEKLPDYQVVRRYLGPAGLFGRSEPDGWFLVGFMLKR